MTRIVPLAVASLVALVAAVDRGCQPVAAPGSASSVEHPPPMEVYFSPRRGCTDAVVGQIDRARSSILVQAYSFTSAPIAKALADAHQRGVDVAVILDKSQESEKYSSADFLIHAGVSTRIDSRHAIAHNKIMILDGQTVITGSFNFTKSAEESNAENLLVIHDAAVAEVYTRNWRQHAEHSSPYTAKRDMSEDAPPAATHSAPTRLAPIKKGKAASLRPAA